jgi:hypothetical protein
VTDTEVGLVGCDAFREGNANCVRVALVVEREAV